MAMKPYISIDAAVVAVGSGGSAFLADTDSTEFPTYTLRRSPYWVPTPGEEADGFVKALVNVIVRMSYPTANLR